MKKVFWSDPYQTTLTTTVSTVEGQKVLFNETIAYSFAGGFYYASTSLFELRRAGQASKNRQESSYAGIIK